MLIKCPECGKEVSDKANSCTHCGYPLTTICREVKKRIEKPINDKVAIIPNSILGIFGLLLLLGILKSEGEIVRNSNATIISVLIIFGALVALQLPKKKSKILLLTTQIAYLIAAVMCVQSLGIGHAYLILEICLGINIFMLIYFAKKNNIY